MLPFFALLCGWSSPQPEKHPPNLSMIPLLVTLASVTRVARRFVSTVFWHSTFQGSIITQRLAQRQPNVLWSFGCHTSRYIISILCSARSYSRNATLPIASVTSVAAIAVVRSSCEMLPIGTRR